jgi:hypothetical protein
MKRPVGVTILAVITTIYGVFSLLLALLGVFGSLLKASGVAPVAYSAGTLAYATISDAVLGAVYLAFGLGAFRLKGWAWTLGVVALALDVVRSLGSVIIQGFSVSKITIPSITIVIALLLLWYLFRPNVRAAFRQTA